MKPRESEREATARFLYVPVGGIVIGAIVGHTIRH